MNLLLHVATDRDRLCRTGVRLVALGAESAVGADLAFNLNRPREPAEFDPKDLRHLTTRHRGASR